MGRNQYSPLYRALGLQRAWEHWPGCQTPTPVPQKHRLGWQKVQEDKVEDFLHGNAKTPRFLAPVTGKLLKKKTQPCTKATVCTRRRQRVPPLLPLHITGLCPSLWVPLRCGGLALRADSPSPSHRGKDSVRVCVSSHLGRVTYPAQLPCSGGLGTPRVSSLKTSTTSFLISW